MIEGIFIKRHVHHISLLMNIIYQSLHLRHILNLILVPPRIVSHSPEHMHVAIREGRDVQFSCIATGHPSPIIIWHVNGLSRPGIVTTGM